MKTLFALLLIFPFSVSSQNLSLKNSATVTSSCSIATVQNIQFGGIDPLNIGTLTSTGAVSLTCTKGAYNISVSDGTGGYQLLGTQREAGFPASAYGWWYTTKCMRAMSNGGQRLYYELYPSSDYSTSSMNSSNEVYSSKAPSSIKFGACASTNAATFSTVQFNSPQSQTVTLYARINSENSDLSTTTPGSYIDTLSVSVTF